MAIPAGARSPESLRLYINRPAGSAVDMTTASEVSVAVRRPNGSTATWAFTIASSTASQIIATRTFSADGSDVPRSAGLGGYQLTATLTFPAGVTRRCRMGVLPVE